MLRNPQQPEDPTRGACTSFNVMGFKQVFSSLLFLSLFLCACSPTEQQRFLRQERVVEFDAFNFSLRLHGARLIGEAEIRSGFICPNESDRGSNITVLKIEAMSNTPIIEVEYNEANACEEVDPIAIELVGLPQGSITNVLGAAEGMPEGGRGYRLVGYSQYLEPPGTSSCAAKLGTKRLSTKNQCKVCDSLQTDGPHAEIDVTYSAPDAIDSECSARAGNPVHTFCVRPCPCRRSAGRSGSRSSVTSRGRSPDSEPSSPAPPRTALIRSSTSVISPPRASLSR